MTVSAFFNSFIGFPICRFTQSPLSLTEILKMNQEKLNKIFDIVCILEIIGCALLFLIAMPMKYGFGDDSLIRPFGMLHGLFFMAFVYLAFKVRDYYKWNTKEFLTVILYAIIPFFTWFVHRKINNFEAQKLNEE